MVKSFRVTIRFNPEYDSETIQSIKTIKGRERSRVLRAFIREGFKRRIIPSDKKDHALLDTKKETKQRETKQVIKWNFPI